MTERMHAERRKDEFISMASHELKTPVTSMKGFGYVLKQRLHKQGDEQAMLYLDKMDRQLNRLSSLISELLDISRMQSGKLVFQQEAFDLSALVKETVEDLQQTTQTHNLCLEEAAPVQVVGDRDRIGLQGVSFPDRFAPARSRLGWPRRLRPTASLRAQS